MGYIPRPPRQQYADPPEWAITAVHHQEALEAFDADLAGKRAPDRDERRVRHPVSGELLFLLRSDDAGIDGWVINNRPLLVPPSGGTARRIRR